MVVARVGFKLLLEIMDNNLNHDNFVSKFTFTHKKLFRLLDELEEFEFEFFGKTVIEIG